MISLSRVIVAALLLSLSTVTNADEHDPSPFVNWFQTANYGFILGSADIELREPEGFDIGQGFFTNGFSDNTLHYGVIAYHPSKFHPNLFTRTKVTLTPDVDYDGLQLDDLALSHGYQLNTPGSLKVAVGVSASASLGLIRAVSFRDETLHVAAGLEVSAFVRIYRVCLEAAAVVREASSGTLDEESVSPSFRGGIISIVAGC